MPKVQPPELKKFMDKKLSSEFQAAAGCCLRQALVSLHTNAQQQLEHQRRALFTAAAAQARRLLACPCPAATRHPCAHHLQSCSTQTGTSRARCVVLISL